MAIDPESLLVTGAIAHASKDVLSQLLGPTAELYGESLKSLAEKCNENFGRIVDRAWKIAGEPGAPGAVNSRVLKHVWDEGRFVDDELAAEYFAGLLASSRNEDGSDDRALPFIHMVSAMSASQIRLHYLVYCVWGAAKTTGKSSGRNLEEGVEVVIIPPGDIHATFVERTEGVIDHALNGLMRLQLIGASSHAFGQPDKRWSLLIEPTAYGAELFLWAHGKVSISPWEFLQRGSDLGNGIDVPDAPLVSLSRDAYINVIEAPVTQEHVQAAVGKAIENIRHEMIYGDDGSID